MILHMTLAEWAKGLPEDDSTSVVYVRVKIARPLPSKPGGYTVALCGCRLWFADNTPVEVEVEE